MPLVILALTACSRPETPAGSQRDFSFYSPLINPSDQYQQAAVNMEQLKLMVSNERYDMRIALFDNGVFYYQVDNLGDGEGSWEYRDGILRLKAVRPVFDMDLDIMAEKAEGENTIVQFVDRFRFNSVPINLRTPAADSKPLKKFYKSAKAI